MSAAKASRLRVVVDGSNLATEGRVTPSLTQLDEAVVAFLDENPGAEMIVVADATFEHRAAPNDRARFTEAMLAGDIVTPPAGAVGRGDAFILKIADRIDGVVLSNDSFQEFHDEYPWLFDVGRLIGGKPVRGVGWVFTPRLPVRNARITRSAAKKLAVALADREAPSVETTPTPLKAAKKSTSAKKATAKTDKKPNAVAAKVADKSVGEPTLKVTRAGAKSPSRAAKTPAKSLGASATTSAPASAKQPRTAKGAVKDAVAKTAKSTKRVALAEPAASPAPTVALRRGRQPVNPEADFALFQRAHRVGARVHGEVTAFTSHGAVISVRLKGGQSVECYAPTTGLGSPAPARARDVLTRGDVRDFTLVTVDGQRRIAELSLT